MRVSCDQVVVVERVLYSGEDGDSFARAVARREVEKEVALGLSKPRVRRSRAVNKISRIAG